MTTQQKIARTFATFKTEVANAITDGYLLVTADDYNLSGILVRKFVHQRNGNNLSIMANLDGYYISIYKNHKQVKTIQI